MTPTTKTNKINGIPIVEPKTNQERLWYSYIKQRVTELGYGKLDFSLTVKNGEVTMIREMSEKTVSLQNDSGL